MADDQTTTVTAGATGKTGGGGVRSGSAFLTELGDVWRRVPDKPLFIGLLTLWVLLFHFLGSSTFGYFNSPSLFRWLYGAYNVPGSEDGHGNLIPIVVLVLFWWKRRELLALPRQVSWSPLLLVGAALVLHLLGFLAQQPRLSAVAFLLGLYGFIGLVWGPAWMKASFFPFVLFGFSIPVGSLAESLTFPLRMLSTTITVWVAKVALGIAVVQDGVQIFDANGQYQYEVAAACSGIRSLISLLALTTIYGFLTFVSAWKRLLFVGLAVPLAIAGNVVRLVSIVIAAETFGQKAGQFVHEWFGFVTFAIALAVILGLGHWLREPAPPQQPARGSLEAA